MGQHHLGEFASWTEPQQLCHHMNCDVSDDVGFLLMQVPPYAMVKFSSFSCALEALQTPSVKMGRKTLVIKPWNAPPVPENISFAERKKNRLLAKRQAKNTSSGITMPSPKPLPNWENNSQIELVRCGFCKVWGFIM